MKTIINIITGVIIGLAIWLFINYEVCWEIAKAGNQLPKELTRMAHLYMLIGGIVGGLWFPTDD